MENLNGRFRDQSLIEAVFDSLALARHFFARWRYDSIMQGRTPP